MNINNDNIPNILEQAKVFIKSGYISKVKALELAQDCKHIIENGECSDIDNLRSLLKNFLYELISTNEETDNNSENDFMDVLVVEHETIESLADNFNTTADVIRKMNPKFKTNEALRTGAILKVPRVD